MTTIAFLTPAETEAILLWLCLIGVPLAIYHAVRWAYRWYWPKQVIDDEPETNE